jgi:hypothetical protein
MLRVAAGKETSTGVDWRLGYSDRADDESADLFVMSGHVAQVFLDDDAWMQVLRDARRAFRRAGFKSACYLGDWDRSELTAESPEIIVTAQAGPRS